MDTLVICPCAHSIIAHENGQCRVPNCRCMLGSQAVLNDAIDLTRPKTISR